MKSLEADLRNLIFKINKEKDELRGRMTQPYNFTQKDDMRYIRLAELESKCLLTIEKEIDFFKQNSN
jgi:hypothetical protein